MAGVIQAANAHAHVCGGQGVCFLNRAIAQQRGVFPRSWPGVHVSMTRVFLTPKSAGWNWREITSAGSLNWRDVSLSENGQIILAAPYGSNLLLSTDSGASWVSKESSRNWSSCDMSGDGATQAAAQTTSGTYDYLYISTNSGISWGTAPNGVNFGFISARVSNNGLNSIAAVSGTGSTAVYRRSGGGSWSFVSVPSASYYGSAVNDSGHMMVCGNSMLLTSTDGGLSWTDRNSAAGSRNWRGAAISSSGQIMVASVGGASGGYIYRSVNGGASWTALTAFGSRVWWGIAMSSDGQTIAAVNNDPGGQLWLSEDGGDTASVVPGAGAAVDSRYGVDISSDGTRIVTAVYGGSIYYGEKN